MPSAKRMVRRPGAAGAVRVVSVMAATVTARAARFHYPAGNAPAPARRVRSHHAHRQPPVGDLLRDWRRRRRLSQLDLALEAGVSTRHLSFVETGRAKPSPEMVLHLAEELEVPLRERNRLLLAAGYAPVYEERALDEPEMQPVQDAIQLVLDGHDPYPAIAVDRAGRSSPTTAPPGR